MTQLWYTAFYANKENCKNSHLITQEGFDVINEASYKKSVDKNLEATQKIAAETENNKGSVAGVTGTHLEDVSDGLRRLSAGQIPPDYVVSPHNLEKMMAYFTYDTSVCISRKLTNFYEMPDSFHMSAVVMMELIAGALDDSRRKFYEGIFEYYKKSKLLIVPNRDDWLLVSRILYLLTHARKRSNKGKLPRLPPGASQRMALDVLIAVSARRWNAAVVTENWVDFKAIQRYCNVTVVRASKFFGK